MIPPPEIHALLLVLASLAAVVSGGVILAFTARPESARLHFVYATTLALWFGCEAMIAVAGSLEVVHMWSRLAQLSLGLLPGVIYHLNVVLAGLEREYRQRIRAHWILSAALVVYGLTWPELWGPPREYAWGHHLSYSAWGLVIAVPVIVTLAEVLLAFRVGLTRLDPRTARYQKARAFMFGNIVATLALVSFLPTFGYAVYPIGYLVLSGLHSLAVFGTVRYRLIEVTPEFAAEHVLAEMPDGVLATDDRDIVRVANPQAAELLGCALTGLVNQPLGDVAGEEGVVDLLLEAEGSEGPREGAFVDRAGQERHVRVSGTVILDEVEHPVARLWVLRDVSDERLAAKEKERLEDSVRNVQKLESLGVMAAGVAHDFNNLLMAIQGNAELARRATGAEDGEVRVHLGKIEVAAQRAAELAGQMLTYTGRRRTSMRPINLNRVVMEVTELLAAAVSKKAAVTLDLDPRLPPVLGDLGQMSQVILNLVTNASEALEGQEGTIVLRTAVGTPDDSFNDWSEAADPGRPRGPCVFLEAADTGRGMDEATLEKIFDPFFTTKFTGRGLGLATVVGIVRSHEGFTRVRSAPGKGTTFTIALPIAAERAPEDDIRGIAPSPFVRSAGRTGLALLADDEPAVRQVVHAMLTDDGFDVVEAVDGREAVAAFADRPGDFSLVVLDHAMPGLDGGEAFTRIRADAPDVPVVFMSGHTDSVLPPLDARTAFLHKPFHAGSLSAKVREVMDA